MTAHSTPTRADYENYLVYLYFGSDQDLLKACINRAYRDFNRPLHGFGKFENADELCPSSTPLPLTLSVGWLFL
jgi:hypothetical protein